MARNINGMTPPVGTVIIDGYQILANYQNRHVLAKSLNAKAPEPFVVWSLDGDGDPYMGSYRVSLQSAELEFVERCFPWFWETPEAKVQAAGKDPEALINFTEVYETHRVGFYMGWMIVQPYDEMDGEILCYLPSDEWDNAGFPDLEYLKDYHTSEWDAGSLAEAVEFIDSYNLED